MGWLLRQKTDPNMVYVDENVGWLPEVPPTPTPPEVKAKEFESKEAAEKFIAQHGLAATTEEKT